MVAFLLFCILCVGLAFFIGPFWAAAIWVAGCALALIGGLLEALWKAMIGDAKSDR